MGAAIVKQGAHLRAGPSFQGDLTAEGALPFSRFVREGGDFDFRVPVS